MRKRKLENSALLERTNQCRTKAFSFQRVTPFFIYMQHRAKQDINISVYYHSSKTELKQPLNHSNSLI